MAAHLSQYENENGEIFGFSSPHSCRIISREFRSKNTHVSFMCQHRARIYICNSFNKKRSNAKSKKRNNLSIGMAMFISDISLLFSKESPQEV